MKRLALSISLAFVPFYLFAVPEGAAQSITLRYGHAAGTTLNYVLNLTTPSAQANQRVSLPITLLVTNVDGSEIMEIETSFGSGTMTINGVPYPLPVQGQVLVTKMSRRGEVVETVAKGQYRDMLSQSGFTSFTSVSPDIFRALGILEFPDGPVSVGGTWSVTKGQTFPSGESINVTYNYTLEALTNYRGYDCAQIKIDSQPVISFYQDFPSFRRGLYSNAHVKIVGTFLFAYTQGRIIKLDETVETNTVGTMITYEGTATVVPSYRKTFISLEIE